MPRRLTLLPLLAIPALGIAQDTLPQAPGYELYQKMSQEGPRSVVEGSVFMKWDAGGNSFTYQTRGKFFKFDLSTRQTSPTNSSSVQPIVESSFRFGPERGRQFETVASPSGQYTARSQNRNVTVTTPSGKEPVTTDGSVASRIKYGTASWVYGEELSQIDSMWWSPDSKKLAYYRFDESGVKDYYLSVNQLRFQDSLNVEAFPKPGQPNPVADIYVYDVESKKSVHIDSRFDSGHDKDLGQYIYNVSWSPNGQSLLFFRMNRLQNQQEMVAADPTTGQCRVIFHREMANGWLEPRTTGEFPSTNPDLWWTKEGPTATQFFYINDESGYRNLDLYDVNTGLVRHVTHHNFDVRTIRRIDAETSTVWYTTQGENNPYLVQLHRCRFSGTDQTLLTDPAFSHRVSVSPSGAGFVDIEQTLDTPATTRVCDADGSVLATLATSDLSKFNALGLKKVERFTFKADDGKTDIYGFLMKPSTFDPSKRYPLLVSVYGGPDFGSDQEAFGLPDPITELGFIVAWIDGRGSGFRGNAFKFAMYHNMGISEIDDQAAGARYLTQRPYIDGNRVGIYGTSYGGYASIMALLRYPDLFKAASASSPVSDWRNYDTIYTERYMGLPDAQKDAYDRGSALPLVKNMKGHLMLYFGTSDNNTHPSHTYMLINALDLVGKSYELALGPDEEHSGLNEARMMEFFIRWLGAPAPSH